METRVFDRRLFAAAFIASARPGLWLGTLALALFTVGVSAQQAGAGAQTIEANSAAASAQAEPPGGWSVQWSPYLWAAGLNGTLGIRGQTSEVDLSFSDVLDKLDGGLFLPVEVRKGRWGVMIELMLMRLSDQAGTPGPLFDEVSVIANQTTVELSARYRILEQQPASVDLLAGARLWHLNDQLSFTSASGPDIMVEAGQRWIDPNVGVRAIADLASHWSILARGDVGGFGVGSDLTWHLMGAIGYVQDPVTIWAGYRHLDVDFVNEKDGFTFDVANGGLIMGVAIRP